MKIGKVLEYLKTLTKIRKNFFTEMSEESTNEIDKAYAQGIADAHAEHQRELEQISLATLNEEMKPAPTMNDEITKPIVLQ